MDAESADRNSSIPKSELIRTILVASLSLVLALVGWIYLAHWEEDKTKAAFEEDAIADLAWIQDGFSDYLQALRSFSGFIEGGGQVVDRDRLDQYAAPLIAAYPGIASFSWIARVSRESLSAFQAKARRAGPSDYRVFQSVHGQPAPLPEQSEYFPVLYAVPEATTSVLLGVETSDEPSIDNAEDRARDTGKFSATDDVPLIFGERGQGFLVMKAAYTGSATPDTVDGRRAKVIGYAVGSFRFGEIVEGAIDRPTEPQGFFVYFFDANAGPNSHPIYVHKSPTVDAPAPAFSIAELALRQHLSSTVTLADRSWRATVVSAEPPASGLLRPMPLSALALGLLLAALATSYSRKRDIQQSRERLLLEKLRASSDRFRTIFESVNDGIFLVSPTTGRISDVNSHGCVMFGYSRSELLGRDVTELLSGEPPYVKEAAMERIAKASETGSSRGEWQVKTKSGARLWVDISLRLAEVGGEKTAFGSVRDISERRQAQAELSRMAHFDGLTGLANRIVFFGALQQAIARRRRDSTNDFAVLYLDLDHFKDINDTLGHSVGDHFLKAVAERLSACVREGDVVARFGGDEFAILQLGVTNVADAAGALADRVLAALRQPFSISGDEIRSGASVGVALWAADSATAEELLKHADVALYRAKAEGRGVYRFFTQAMDAAVQARVHLNAELRRAVESEEFFVLFQPQVDGDSGIVTGLEALVRWRHPERGIVGPGEFIEAAEETGLITALGQTVFRDACRQVKEWLIAGLSVGTVSVNVSAVQLKGAVEFERRLKEILKQTGLPAEKLEVELTESVLMAAASKHNEMLIRLRGIGVKIAIDDFGTGYSSLDYLRRYPVDRIKIAQNFVKGIGQNVSDDAIVKATIGLARELKIAVIAEGVETSQQAMLLRDWGCHSFQGYYFAEPLSASETELLLRRGVVRKAGLSVDYVQARE
jgi:diguanylate cyclase (GGDEF)-like protein/PAS domain S-box-containing protein